MYSCGSLYIRHVQCVNKKGISVKASAKTNMNKYCNKPGQSDQPIRPWRRAHRLRLGEVIEGVYLPVEVLQPLGTWHWSHLEPTRQSGEGLKEPAQGRRGGREPERQPWRSVATNLSLCFDPPRTTLLEGPQTPDGKTPNLKFVPLPLPWPSLVKTNLC